MKKIKPISFIKRTSSAFKENKIYYDSLEEFSLFMTKYGFTKLKKEYQTKVGKVRIFEGVKNEYDIKTVELPSGKFFVIFIF